MSKKLITLGEKLFHARTNADLTARQVADAADISPAYLRTIETGKNPKTKKPSRPRAIVIAKVAAKLNLDVRELLTLAEYNPDLFEGTGSVATGHLAEQKIRALVQDSKNIGQLHPFLRARTLEELDEFAAKYKAMTSGIFRCPPEKDRFFVRTALESCRSQLRVVTSNPPEWWNSRHAQRYLDLHEPLSRRNVEMTRVFVVDESEEDQLEPALRRHDELGITYHILNFHDVEDHQRLDFVIYDDSLLRFVTEVVRKRGETRIAEFTQDKAQVNQSIVNFDYLKRLAQTG